MDGMLHVYSNGVIDFEVCSVPVRIEIRWDASTGFSRILFLEASEEKAARAETLLKKTWPKIKLIREDGKYRVDIPAEYRHPHEEHFNMVGQEFI